MQQQLDPQPAQPVLLAPIHYLQVWVAALGVAVLLAASSACSVLGPVLASALNATAACMPLQLKPLHAKPVLQVPLDLCQEPLFAHSAQVALVICSPHAGAPIVAAVLHVLWAPMLPPM